MANYSITLKELFQQEFSLPFVVKRSMVSGEPHYVIAPEWEADELFEVDIYIHNGVRVIIEAKPQLHAGAMIDDMKAADDSKVMVFKEFAKSLRDKGANVKLTVNGYPITVESLTILPDDTKTFCITVNKPSAVDFDNQDDEAEILFEWSSLVVSMVLSLLKIVDTASLVDGYEEGNRYEVKTKRYERNPINRKLCLSIHGYRCKICGFSFEDQYGAIGKSFIHVHHVTPVSMLGPGYVINPAKDLIPVCPNCHAMMHRKYPPYTPEEVLEAILDKNDID